MKQYRLLIDYEGNITITERVKHVLPSGFITYSSRTVYEGPEDDNCVEYEDYYSVYKLHQLKAKEEELNGTNGGTKRTSRRLSSKNHQK